MTTHDFKLTVLVEDTSNREDLVPEHGWAVLVESENGLGLFDTGQTCGVLPGNARNMGVDLEALSWIVLSHGHYDHTGGLKAVLDIAARPAVFAHPEVFDAKYVKETSGRWRDAGMPISRGETERAGAQLQLTAEPIQLGPKIMTTGRIPRTADCEFVGDEFFVERDGRKIHDEFPDDQAIVLRTRRGPVVLLGCAHSGVVNTLRHVANITGEREIHAVLGGMHLGKASEERISKTIAVFREYNVQRIGSAHCTGKTAEKAFIAAFAERCFLCPAGSTITF